ncbi:hypothetical protein [Sulfitobacter donghicola]|uniref:Ferrochelatase n=1 Tax=Sulfitobacter donghicola DSW-25 = KCTC 12864 = JCM 14565 TaxID=1300350 RepID=A0A073INE1_9RHOB|nr:hypothetical protein [Sulfitobacter donghicola]KEJ91065.1 hypothetical protein DSW25_02175 [Sulfitobacter donghicola DSW-25 = KCTC 12864 = JCM 14565]KIN68000.1 hypothetical protein Z948_1723 [Sulfitobacter donghicola DSW-25 = KCTC 12864 = JCM 14565]
MLKTISLATIVAFAATTSFAGSLAQPEEKDDVTAFVPAGGSGIGAPAIIGGVLAAVAIAALVSDSDDDDDGSVDGHGTTD